MRLAISAIILMAALTVGCDVSVQSSDAGADMPPPATHFDGAISLALRAPAQVRQGEQITGLDVVMTNEGDEPFTFRYSGNLLDFEVLDEDGDVIWSYLGGWDMPLGRFTLAPGKSKVLSDMEWSRQGEWDLRDREGFPAESGEYGIRGVVRLGLPSGDEYGAVDPLKTSLHTLTVQSAPLPDYAEDIEMTLVVPDEAQGAAPIPIDLRFTNTGEEPVALWWSGVNAYPLRNYMNIYVFRDGEPIWDVASVIDINNRGTVTLGPGESRTMSDLTFETSGRPQEGTGEPWLWNQRADCRKHPGNPCGKLVTPGTYTVRAVVNVSTKASFSADHAAIATEPHELVILPSDEGHDAAERNRIGALEERLGALTYAHPHKYIFQIAKRVPEWCGYYTVGDAVHVCLTHSGYVEAARSTLAEELSTVVTGILTSDEGAVEQRGLLGHPVSEDELVVKVERDRYSLLQLLDWYWLSGFRSIHRPDSGVVTVAAGISAGRLIVELEVEEFRGGVEAELVELGIPLEAVYFDVTGPLQPLTQ